MLLDFLETLHAINTTQTLAVMSVPVSFRTFRAALKPRSDSIILCFYISMRLILLPVSSIGRFF